MGKLIFLLVLVIVVWAVVKSYLKSRARDEKPRVAAPEDMVRCVHCGVHLPRSESVASGGNLFCSEDHLRLHGR